MKIKTSELTGAALDWAVAKAEGYTLHKDQLLFGDLHVGWWISGRFSDPNAWISLLTFVPSTNWSQGGPIIDKKRINLMYCHPESSAAKEGILCVAHRDGNYLGGPSGLVAAMRCFVASKLGEEIEVPKELV